MFDLLVDALTAGDDGFGGHSEVAIGLGDDVAALGELDKEGMVFGVGGLATEVGCSVRRCLFLKSA